MRWDEARCVSVGYGEAGEGFFRISLTYPDEVLEEALGRITQVKL